MLTTLHDANKSYENMTVDIQDTKWHHVMIISRQCSAQIYFDKFPVTRKQELYPCHRYAFNRIEVIAVKGGWSKWGPWIECSVSCGEGRKSRKRLCNNPYPDSGGEDCNGDNEHHQICNDTACRSCPEMKALANGIIECSNENETISCNITCNDGYEFDIAPLDNYICGPETFHEWNFETADNPSRKLPTCVGHDEEKLSDVQTGFQKIQDAAENGGFTIRIIHDKFNLDNGLTSLSGNLQCGHGMTRVKHYCVPCGAGAYLYRDFCESCGCPKGRTTLGMGSVSIDECSVEKVMDIEEGIKVLTIVLATSIPVAVVILLICVYRRLKSTLKRPIDPAKMSEYPMQHTTSDPLAVPNRRFLMK